jgi:uncharacterized protein YjbI with pentapeptide repeats
MQAANWPLASYSEPVGPLPANYDGRERVSFNGESLQEVNFTYADLDSCKFDGAHLQGCHFYDASLVGARMEHAEDLAAWQFRGADLTGARLPEAIKKFEGLKAVDANTKTAARSFAATILACLYCWLTIGTTTDAEFFGAAHATALPFLQTKISPYGFYAVAPLLLAVMFLYLQFSLQQLWEAFASLPAFFDDGRALHERAAPFFLSAIVRTEFRRLREKAPGLAKWQTILAWLLGWCVVPFTIALLWLRALVARLAWITAIQLLSLGAAIAASLFFFSTARGTLRGAPIAYFDNWRQWLLRAPFPRKFIWAALVTASLSVFSVFVFQDAKFLPPWFDADLAYARLSPDEVSTAAGGERRGNSLWGRNLRGCYAPHADMANVDFPRANLSGCYFMKANLRNAMLFNAELSRADFNGADLRGATFLHNRGEASAAYADLQGATIDLAPDGPPFSDIFTTNNWILARWNNLTSWPDLGLPEEHTDRLIRKDLTSYDLDKLNSRHLQHADLKGWILRNCIFTGVDLQGSDLSHSDLRDTLFDKARLTNVNLEGADLRGSDLSKAQGLTQWQLNSAITGKSITSGNMTKFPPGLHGAQP